MATFWLSVRVVLPDRSGALPWGQRRRLDLFDVWVCDHVRLDTDDGSVDAVRDNVLGIIEGILGHVMCPADGRIDVVSSSTTTSPELVVGGNHYD